MTTERLQHFYVDAGEQTVRVTFQDGPTLRVGYRENGDRILVVEEEANLGVRRIYTNGERPETLVIVNRIAEPSR